MTPGVDVLERTRSAVVNVLMAAGIGIAVSGWLIRWRDQWALSRVPVGVGRALIGALMALAVASYVVRRWASGADPSRFYRGHVSAAILAAMAVPLGLAYGWYVRPRLDAVGPFWVVALTLGFLAFPRPRERDDVDSGADKTLP